jgi:hypothetical protein
MLIDYTDMDHPFSYLTLNLDVDEVPPSPLAIDFPMTIVEEYEVEVKFQEVYPLPMIPAGVEEISPSLDTAASPTPFASAGISARMDANTSTGTAHPASGTSDLDFMASLSSNFGPIPLPPV